MRASDTGVTYWFNLVAWGGNHFIANAIKREQPFNMVVRSADGDTWEKISDLSISGYLADAAYGNGRFVAVSGGTTIYSDDDGATWTEVTPAATAQPLRAIAWNGTRFVAVGKNGTIVTSP